MKYDNLPLKRVMSLVAFQSIFPRVIYSGSLLKVTNIERINIKPSELNIEWIEYLKELYLFEMYFELVEGGELTLNLFSCATVSLSTNFSSIVLLLNLKDGEGYLNQKALFLLNISNGKILSVVKVASEDIFEGDITQTYSVCLPHGQILYFQEEFGAGDIISYENVTKGRMNKPEKYILDEFSGYFSPN